MKKEDLTPYLHQRVKIYLIDGFTYTGFVESVSEEVLVLKDKFGHAVSISLKTILIVTSHEEWRVGG